ncbi:hypothetical protein SEA_VALENTINIPUFF_3 [Microbacterium phage ValentiniPuff]|uniref:Uncharacterized protein n=1 Tax=Microbacterium phage ValentiniPuff TaxID=2315705 RepID=A0A386KSK2_9CAUD|nr:hypothetical protein SEA_VALENTINIPUFF_3 [Microbacterium phage ValentiniPuff]
MTNDDYGLGALPWEPMKDETTQAYAAFIAYRDLGPRRSMREAARKYYDDIGPDDPIDPKSGRIRNFERWSSRFKWVHRAEEWDHFLQENADADEVAAIKAMRTRHVQLMTVMQSKAAQYLNTITDADLKKMTPDTAMRMLDLAIKNERLARGVPDTIQGIQDSNGKTGEAAVAPISAEALDRRLEAFLAAHDPENDIEKGEPAREDEDDDLLDPED